MIFHKYDVIILIAGELVEQAERKVIPSTLRPDLGNASVGSVLYKNAFGKLRSAVSRFLLGGRYGKDKRRAFR